MANHRAILFSLSLVFGPALFGAWSLITPKTPRQAALAPGVAAAGSSIVFSDDFETNPQGRWAVHVRGSSSGPTGVEHTLTYEASGGNPGGFRAMNHRIDGDGNLFVAYVYTEQYYLPSEQGAITSINYKEDRLSLDGRPVGARVAVWQGGQVHVAVLSTFRDQAWTTETAQGLTAADFTPVPDFSLSGDTIWFGYERANTNTNPNGVQVKEHGIDNWSVEVSSGPPPVPGLTCTVEPQAVTKGVGRRHVMRVWVTEDGGVPELVFAELDVVSGPNAGTFISEDAFTVVYYYDSNGEAGTDIISGTASFEEEAVPCAAEVTWGANAPPVANDDTKVVDAEGDTVNLCVLRNDVDPNGDRIAITNFTPTTTGITELHGDTCDPFGTDPRDFLRSGYFTYREPTQTIEALNYTITDGEFSDDASVTVLVDCGCTTECLSGLGKTARTGTEAIDLGLLRRFRDDVMKPTAIGSNYVDIYYDTTPEIARILILDQPALGSQAVRMVEALQPALRDVLEGDGTALITQAQMDSVAAFFADLSAAGSQSLQQLIADELARVGPLDAYVGLPVRDVLTTVLGEGISTSIAYEAPSAPTGFALQQNFPNPFTASTEIRYVLSQPTPVSLTIYNVQGQKVRTLIDTRQRSGVKSATWDGLNDAGDEVASGVYLFRLQTPTFQATKTMVLRK